MFKVYYQNNFRETVCLTEWPYMITGGNVFDGDWSEIKNEDHIQGFERGIEKKKLIIDIKDKGFLFYKAIDRLEEVVERDIINNTPGRLYVGDNYLKCFITGTSKDRWVNDLDSMSCELEIKTDYCYWITEVELPHFQKSTVQTNPMGLDYPYEYPFEYTSDSTIQYLNNDHYTDSGFKLTIYGPCINPAIRIGGHVYELFATLYDDEYAIVDSSTRNSVERTLIRVMQDGTKLDLFNSRNKDSEIWKKIPPGRSVVTWNGNFGFDIVLFMERGTPRWTLLQQTSMAKKTVI